MTTSSQKFEKQTNRGGGSNKMGGGGGGGVSADLVRRISIYHLLTFARQYIQF